MATLYTLTAEVPEASTTSYYTTDATGKVTGTTTGGATASVTIPGLPVGASITRVTLTVTTTASAGNTLTLTANGVTLAPNGTSTVDVTATINAAGTHTIQYWYRCSGQKKTPAGTYPSTVFFKDAFLTVEYVGEDPVPAPEDEETPETVLQTTGEIILYSPWAVEFGGTYGEGILHPTECTVTQEAGGEYSVAMQYRITPDGKWQGIVPFAIIQAPVPAEDTPMIDSAGDIVTEGMEIWRAGPSCGWYLTTNVVLRPAWQPRTYYAKGAYCRYNGNNWKAIAGHTSGATWADTTNFWKSMGNGYPRPVRTLPEWTRLYVSDSSGDYLYVKLSSGETGYTKKTESVYIRTATDADIAELTTSERHITDQPFRVTQVDIDGATLNARAQHVSYDANLWLLDKIQIDQQGIGDAILDIKTALIGETPGPDGREPFRIFAEDMGRTGSASYSNKSPTTAILDPDCGLVSLYKARLVRDRWDFFLVSNATTDRGFRLTYGINLTGVKWTRSFDKLITRIRPVAKDADGQDYYLAEVFVDSPVINAYPVRAYEDLKVDAKIGGDKPDGSGDTWTEEEVIAEMRQKAADRFLVDHVDSPTVTLDVEFALLGQAAGFDQYRGLERVSLYDTVTVYHPDIGLETSIQVKGYEWDAIRQRFNKITLGDVFNHGTRQMFGFELADGAISLAKLDASAVEQLQGTT